MSGKSILSYLKFTPYPKFKIFLFNSSMISTAELSYTQVNKQNVIVRNIILPFLMKLYVKWCTGAVECWIAVVRSWRSQGSFRRNCSFLLFTLGFLYTLFHTKLLIKNFIAFVRSYNCTQKLHL